jgi:tRNA (guanine-N7-)-methyltransferase
MPERTFYLEYAVQAREFERYPLNWENLFERKAPLAVEIGFGNGDFLVDWAAQKPGWNFVGIELSLESMVRIQKRLHWKGITNIRPLHEEAFFSLREFFPENSLHHIIMNFPDPWPKERHKKRRLLNENFTEILSVVLEDNGCYELVTDQEWYAEHAHALFRESPYFEVAAVETNPSRPVTTKYEQKWREMGRSSYRVLARKIRSAAINRLLEDTDMPHAFIDKEIDFNEIEKLVGLEHTEAEQLFVVKSAFSDAGQNRFLLRTIAKDGAFRQGFYIVIKRHDKQRWLVKLDTTVLPYRTPAVKMAVWKIGEILNEGII